MSETDLYIGLMSGTSMDALDAILVGFSRKATFSFNVICHHTQSIDPDLKRALIALNAPGVDDLSRYACLDRHFGELSATAVNQLCAKAGVLSTEIKAIGSHGQTVRHAPNHRPAYTLQLGDPNTIAELTGITTVADFRRRDIAAGGQGAPLVPAFHAEAFRSPDINRLIVNIGGISNISVLPADLQQPVTGWDIGPGNVLMDAWCMKHLGHEFDNNGEWASTDEVSPALLDTLLNDAFFNTPAPKSTGRDYFNEHWLPEKLSLIQQPHLTPASVQRTLLQLTAQTIASDCIQAIQQLDSHSLVPEIFVCGGGAKNQLLMQTLASLLPQFNVNTTDSFGLSPQLVEATAFAWLAYRTMMGLTGNLPEVTGAHSARILGGIYPA